MKYLKKPVEVEAWHVGHEVAPDWANNERKIAKYHNGEVGVSNKYGSIKAYEGDYVVKDGSQFYVLHESEFENGYEAAE